MQFMQTSRAQGIFFAVLWTGLMWWWSTPKTMPEGVLLIACGLAAGMLYGWAMGKVIAWLKSRTAA